MLSTPPLPSHPHTHARASIKSQLKLQMGNSVCCGYWCIVVAAATAHFRYSYACAQFNPTRNRPIFRAQFRHRTMCRLPMHSMATTFHHKHEHSGGDGSLQLLCSMGAVDWCGGLATILQLIMIIQHLYSFQRYVCPAMAACGSDGSFDKGNGYFSDTCMLYTRFVSVYYK